VSTTLKLSADALSLLRLHSEGRSLIVGGPKPESLPGRTLEETRNAYRELADAGLMLTLHSFVGGKESLYRLTEAGRAVLNDPAASPPPR
jgi:hypothetical protein